MLSVKHAAYVWALVHTENVRPLSIAGAWVTCELCQPLDHDVRLGRYVCPQPGLWLITTVKNCFGFLFVVFFSYLQCVPFTWKEITFSKVLLLGWNNEWDIIIDKAQAKIIFIYTVASQSNKTSATAFLVTNIFSKILFSCKQEGGL